MIALKYGLCALVAVAVNLASQRLVLWLYRDPSALAVAIAAGTLTGLAAKYMLDKKIIFEHVPRSYLDDAKKFLRYTLTGGLTTLLFWGTELGCHFAFSVPIAKYLGALLGLTAGYAAKYFLDKNLVFTEAP